jgi:hypothetical protein
LGVPLGGRIGSYWGHQVRYAKRTGPLGLFGPRVVIKGFPEIERELRDAIEAWLADREAKKA